MEPAAKSATRVSLLGRLGRDPADPAAWSDFVDHYGRQIYGWCRQWRLQDGDACDVMQEVLLKLAAKMRDFRYDSSQSFRGWLKTITHHALVDFLRDRQRTVQGTGDTRVLKRLYTEEAREDLLRRLEREFDRELLEIAVARVRLRVESRTWESFRLLAFEGLSGAEAAKRLGMKVATVFVARSKVQRMVQHELRRLEEPEMLEINSVPQEDGRDGVMSV